MGVTFPPSPRLSNCRLSPGWRDRVMNRRPPKPHGQPSKAKRRPFSIGVWCDYGFTLAPLGGIGVFVYNLIAGLFEQEEPIEGVMLVRDCDQHATSLVKNCGSGRLDAIPLPTT